MFKSIYNFENSRYRLPFNCKTPIGYGIAFVLQAFALMISAQTSLCSIGLLVGYFGLMTSFSQDIQRKLRNLNENYEISRNDEKIRSEFSDFVEFYSDVKELRSNRQLIKI